MKDQQRISVWELSLRKLGAVNYISMMKGDDTETSSYEYLMIIKGLIDQSKLNVDDCLFLERRKGRTPSEDQAFRITWDRTGAVFLSDYSIGRYLMIFPNYRKAS